MDTTIINFHSNTPANLTFAVIAAKADGGWLFVRHKERSTLELPGGHIEGNETPTEACKRELYEETGAIEFKIYPVIYYSVTIGSKTTYGQLFYADITKSGPLPDREIAEVIKREQMPANLTYPFIQPVLFNKVNDWLKMQSAVDAETWDIYDKDRNPTGRTHKRKDPMNDGDYHIVVHVWVMNSKGEFLITKRTPNKPFPNMWESTGGSALSGDDSLTAAIREVKEETNIVLNPENGEMLFSIRRGDSFSDIWLFRQDFSLDKVILQEYETCDSALAAKEQILKMVNDGRFVPFRYLDRLFEII